MKSAESQGRGVLSHPLGNLFAYRTNKKGGERGRFAQRACHWGDLSSQSPPHSQKLVLLTFTLCHLRLGTQTRQGQWGTQRKRKESSTCLADKSWIDLTSRTPEGLLCQHWAGLCAWRIRWNSRSGVKLCSKPTWPCANRGGMLGAYCFWSMSYVLGPVPST